jgi:hypothetical protein
VYNAKGRKVSATEVQLHDTSTIINQYDAQGRWIEEIDSRKGQRYETTSNQFEPDGTYVRTVVATPLSDGLSCPDDKTTVTVWDKDDNLLSETITKEKGGRPFTDITLHKYVFKNGHTLCDSTIHTEQGYLYSLSSVEVRTKKYDAHDNLIEKTEEGGGQYRSNSREIWKYNEYSKMLEDDEYNSCNADKPESYTLYTYYPGGTRLKKSIDINIGGYRIKNILSYTPDSRKEESIMFYNSGIIYQTIYTYQK